MILTDTQIIDNTHFEQASNGELVCFTVLPDGGKFAEIVPDKETVSKNFIGWCNTVRKYQESLEVDDTEERVAAKKRRKSGPITEVPADQPKKVDGGIDSRQIICEHFDRIQSQIDHLGTVIEDSKTERNTLRSERDYLQPIVTLWRGE